MRRVFYRRWTIVLAVVTAARCGYDAQAPYDPPDVPPPDDTAQTAVNELWTVTGSVPAIEGLTPDQLLHTGTVTPAKIITTPDATLFTLNAVAFDDTGTLWVASREDSLLLAFAPSALAASGNREATRIIAPVNQSLGGPTGLAFDRQHRLWVANFDLGTIVRYDRAGAREPAKKFRTDGRPTALAFDAAGALWVSQAQVPALVSYSAAQLEREVPTPDVVLSARDSSLQTPSGLAFDAAGTLWVANTANSTVVAFTPADLRATGAPAPHVTLRSNAGSLAFPTGLAFDADGSLWVIGVDGALSKFGRAQLQATGAPVPAVRLRLGGDVLFWSIALWPKPAGLPIN